jgi:DNA-binding beta-propeller fold protein YncE
MWPREAARHVRRETGIVINSGPRATLKATLLSATLLTGVSTAVYADDLIPDNSGLAPVPSGQTITTNVIPGATFTNMTVSIPTLANPTVGPDGAIQSALNPADGKTLVVMTSGYNTYDTTTGASAAASYNGVSGPEYIFVFDTTNPTAPVRNMNPLGQTTSSPAAALTPQDTFQGLIWSADGTKLYVSGGTDGDVLVYNFNLTTKTFSGPTKIQLIQAVGVPAPADADANGIGNTQYLGPQTSGLALNPAGTLLVALNMLNDSMSVVNTATNTVLLTYDLRPYNTTPATGTGVAGGEEPYGVAISPDGNRAYISSIRDREVDVIDLSQVLTNGTVSLITRIPVQGSPNNVVLKASTNELFVAEDNSDQVADIDTNPASPTYNTVIHTIDAIAPPSTFPSSGPRWTGAATNNLGLSPDGSTLYVTNGGANDVAIVPLAGASAYTVAGLIPTGWYPQTVTASADGSALYIFNAKSDPGSNPGHMSTSVNSFKYTTYPSPPSGFALEYGADQYVFPLEQSGFLTVPVAAVNANLATLTAQVEANNGWNSVSTQPSPTMLFLQGKIQHIIYIVKENRTFDQVLGDLTNGANADPALTTFGKVITPNFHRIASNFVTLDNFFDPGEVSGNGWPWSTSARETDWNVKSIPMDYTFGYGSYSHPVVTRSNAPYDAEGQNANVSVGYSVFNPDGSYNAAGTVALRTLEGGGFNYANTATFTNSGNPLPGGAINLRPGPAEPGAPDGAYAFSGMPENSPYQTGYLWNAALNKGLTIRNYGFFSDNEHYGLSAGTGAGNTGYVLPLENPEAAGCQSAIPLTAAAAYPPGAQQEWTAAKDLIPYTDVCFHGFDNAYPDAWRFEEFRREFTNFVANNNLPNLVLLRYMHDHMGNFGSTVDAGTNYPEAQQADNDYAVGATLAMLANSPYAGNTLVFVVEDDAQDGPDHMDAHRSTAYVVGPYVKKNAVVSTRYSTVNMIRTIEDILGLQHVNLNTAYQPSMDAVFNTQQSPSWTYSVLISSVLRGTTLNFSQIFPDQPVQYAEGDYAPPHAPAYWAEKTRGFDFSSEDRIPTDLFNQVLWEGLMGGKPYPTVRNSQIIRAATPVGIESAGSSTNGQ